MQALAPLNRVHVCSFALGPGWDNMNESIEYELAGYHRRAAAVKWFSFAICLTIFVVYGLVAG